MVTYIFVINKLTKKGTFIRFQFAENIFVRKNQFKIWKLSIYNKILLFCLTILFC